MEVMKIEIRKRYDGGYYLNYWDSMFGEDLNFVIRPEGRVFREVYDSGKDEIVEEEVTNSSLLSIISMFWIHVESLDQREDF